ncbi:MAG: type transport system permease protein [Chloroflexota bacterium]|jgi:ABC transporter DrrB family efflux protein|nr:type transport system permease protein [Chloroflexota bacterium]
MSTTFLANVTGPALQRWWGELGYRIMHLDTAVMVALIASSGVILAALTLAVSHTLGSRSDSIVTLPPVRAQGLRAFVSDTLVLTRRNLLLSRRTPQLVVAAAIMPVMFVLLFRYVFGGSIHVAGYANYVDYLIPGIIVQTTLFGGSSSAVSVAEDLTKGVTDRFRSLPTHRGAILTARTLADLVRLTYTVALMILIGLLVGFRFHNGLPSILAGIGIALFFGYACSWLFALLGLAVRNVEAATLAALVVTFPLVFAASTFTSTETMPGWLRTFANAQPVTNVIDALRALTEGTGSAEQPVLNALAWSAGILVVAATLALRRFREA